MNAWMRFYKIVMGLVSSENKITPYCEFINVKI
jgi:hypothetical protein